MEIVREAAEVVSTSVLAERFGVSVQAGIESRAEGLRRLIQAAGGVFVPDAQMAAEMARYRASLHEVGNGVAQIAKQMTQANRRGQGAVGGTSAEFTELRLAQMRGLARFILDSADEIDLLLRRRRDAMQLIDPQRVAPFRSVRDLDREILRSGETHLSSSTQVRLVESRPCIT